MLTIKKFTRLFISCVTFFVCLSMLNMVVLAQDVDGQGFNPAFELVGSTSDVVSDTKNQLLVDISVLSQTAVLFGDEIDYRLVIRNQSELSITGATVMAAIPYGARFNLIESGSPTFTYNATDNQIEMTPTHGITLAAGASQMVEFEVDTTATCGTQIVNEITVRANGEALTKTNSAMIWDRVHTSYNFEEISQAPDGGIEAINPFTTTSGEWQVGTVLSPTFLGVASGRQAWGTNLAGAPKAGQHVLEGMLDLSGLQGSNEIPLYLTWQEYFDPAASTNKGRVYVGGELIYETTEASPERSRRAVTTGYVQRVVEIQQFAGEQVTVKFVFEADEGPSTSSGHGNQTHLGWYIDDLAVTQCDVVQFEMNMVASTDRTATCDMTSSATDKKEHPAEWTGLTLYKPSDVYYCYAIENSGNVTLTEHHLRDDMLGEIIASANQFVVPPGTVRDTVSQGIIISQTVTEHLSNRAIWKASPPEFYQIVSHPTDGVPFNDIWGIGRILEVKDDSEIRVTLPFDFEYFGTTYEAGHNVVVGNNGGVLFDNEFGLANVPAINSALPLTGSEGMNQAIFPFWDDLDDGWVLTDTQGVAPQREFIVQWTNMPHKNGSSYEKTITFQARLYESSNEIVFAYKDVDFEDERFDYGSSATIGLNKSQDSALQYAFKRDVLTNGLEIRFVPYLSASDSEHVYLQKIAIELNATVSSEPEEACEASEQEIVLPNEHVTYCYTVKNTGDMTVTHHQLVDSQLGTLIDYRPITLEPGMTYTFKSQPTSISEHMKNQVEWQAWIDSLYEYKTSADVNGPPANAFEDIGLNSKNEGTALNIANVDEGNADEGDGEVTVTMPFSFTFYGVTSDLLRIAHHGGILFNRQMGDISPSNEKLPVADLPLAILPYWDHLDGGTGNVYVKTMGEAPQRRFIVQWDRFLHWQESSSDGTFQVILYEGSNEILFQYKDLDFGSAEQSNPLQDQFNYGQSATIGLNQNGRNAHEYAFNNGSTVISNNLLIDGFAILWTPVKVSATDSTTVAVNFTPSIELTATVGIYRNNCATTTEISVTEGTTVYYCFMIENTGNVTLTSHNLSDTIVGINNIYNFNLAPGETINITEVPGANVQAKNIITDTVNRTEWTAINYYDHVANDSASVQVNVNFQPPLAVTIGEIHVSMPIMAQERRLGGLATVLLLLAGGYLVYFRDKTSWGRH